MASVKQIQGTNDSSIVSKCSMAQHGYFKDPFVSIMAGKHARRAPLINRGYYIRSKVVDHAIQKFISSNQGNEYQIVSIGAGFDTTYFRLKSSNVLKQAVFVEVDFFDVVKSKAAIISQSADLRNLISVDDFVVRTDSYILIDSADYKLVGTNLAHTNVLEACLRACGLDFEAPTLFLSECVITYMTKKTTSDLLHFISRSFDNSIFVLYEQIYPDDAFGKFMCAHFKKLGSPLRCIDTYKTREDQRKRFHEKGWQYVEIVDMNEFYFNFVSAEEKARVEELEVFDEYEEWHLKCSHYFLLIAQKDYSDPYFGSAYSRPQPCLSVDPEGDSELAQCHSVSVSRLSLQETSYSGTGVGDSGNIKVHTLCACYVPSVSGGAPWVVRVCGYGQDPLSSGHTRLTNLSVVRMTDEERLPVTHFKPEGHEALDGGICRSLSLLSPTQFLLFGGRISPYKTNASLLRLSFHPPTHSSSTNSDPSDALLTEWYVSCDSLGPLEGSFSTLSDWPMARWRHCTGIYWIENKAYMFLMGGRTLEDKCLNDCWIYSVMDNVWTKLSPDPTKPHPGARIDACLTPLFSPIHSNPPSSTSSQCDSRCCMILSGGRDSDLCPSDQLWRWCGRKMTWALLPVVLPRSRFSHTAHTSYTSSSAASVLILVGGILNSPGDPSPILCRVDLNTMTAVDIMVDMSNLSRDHLLMLHNHASVVTSDNDIIIIGGGGNCFSFGTHLNSGLYRIHTSQLLCNADTTSH